MSGSRRKIVDDGDRDGEMTYIEDETVKNCQRRLQLVVHVERHFGPILLNSILLRS